MPAHPPHEIRIVLRSLDAAILPPDSPLASFHLHRDVANLIQKEAEQASAKVPFRMVFVVPAEDSSKAGVLGACVKEFFQEHLLFARRELQAKIRQGFKSLFIATLVVATLVFLVEFLQAFGQGYLYRIFGESLVIIGWVTMWMPAETLLVEQFPIRNHIRRLQRLASAELVVQATGNR